MLLSASLLVVGVGAGLVSCDDVEMTIVYSGPASQETWVRKVAEEYLEDRNAEREAEGLGKLGIEFVQHGEDAVDSEVTDWTTGPDVYAFASDKILTLYQAGALAQITGSYASFIEDTMTEEAIEAVTFANGYYAYPYAGDNGYYLFYDAGLLTEDDVQDMTTLMNYAATNGYTVAYPLNTAYYSAGALFTFGAGYTLEISDTGTVTSIEATFDTEEGLLAGAAIYNIMTHSAYQETQEAPLASAGTNSVVACVDGSWNASTYKEQMGDNFACTKLPSVTVSLTGTSYGDITGTANLSSYLGYKMLGVNPQVSSGDSQRLLEAHLFAEYLASYDVQSSRFDEFGTAPTNATLATEEKVTSDPAIVAISEQATYAVAQTAVPGNIWTAPSTFTQGIKDGTITLENMEAALETLNASIEASE